MLFGGDDDDDNDFSPSASTGSKLSSLFGGPSKTKSNLKYVAPKQPRSDSIGGGGAENSHPTVATAPQQGQSQPPVVLIGTAVHAYLYVNDVAQSQGRAMCCILGNVTEKSFQLLLYRSKQDHLTRATIHPQFNFTVMANNYASFSDDQQRTWSIMIDTGQYTDFVTQVGVCLALSTLTTSSSQYFCQDVIIGEGPAVKEGDLLQISYTTWNICNGKKGEQIEEPKSGHRVKLKESSVGWETKLLGAQLNTQRLIFSSSLKDSTSLIFHHVSIERVKLKSSGELSGRNTPQRDLQHHHKDISTSNRSLNMLPEDTESSLENEGVPISKATIKSRMARMGHALLPSASVTHSRHLPSDSESEVEEIRRRRSKQKYTSGSVSGSIEELEATPAMRSRAASTHSDSMKPDPVPRPPHLQHQPQQLVVYQSPWQQPTLMPPGYTAVQQGSQVMGPATQPPVAPTPDPTMSLLFSETRSQNTELKISVSKMSDKIDALSNKIENLEGQLKQQGSSAPQSSLVPVNTMTTPYAFPPANTSFDTQAILTQITSLVTDNDDMKARLEEKEKKINALNDSVTQLLQKNQKLLEEKTDMLMAKQESGATVSITEAVALREEKSAVSAQLGVVQVQLQGAKDEAVESRKVIEKQTKEIEELKMQVQEESSKRVELENVSESLKKKEVELNEKLEASQSEKDNLKQLLEEQEAQKKESQDNFSKLADKKTEFESLLRDVESERDLLKDKLKTTLQKMEEAQVQKLEAEKETLKRVGNESKNASTNSEDVVATVKKVMNTVFRSLKSQFGDDESYSGAVVMETLLSVIRDTTLQLLEEVDKKQSVGEGNSAASKIDEKSQDEDRGNDGNVNDSESDRKRQLSEVGSGNIEKFSLAGSTYCEKTPLSGCDSNVLNEKEKEINQECTKENDSIKERVREEIDVELRKENDVDGIDKVDEIKNERNTVNNDEKRNGELIMENRTTSDKGNDNIDIENRTEVSSSEGEYTDASDRQFSPEGSVSSSDNSSSSYDCEQSVNAVDDISDSEKDVNIDDDIPSSSTSTEKDVNIAANKDISDVEGTLSNDNCSIIKKTPVIDMENTQVSTIPQSEKSDSSRDSSLDRVWKPKPPPPPLFSDEEDDDDWLS